MMTYDQLVKSFQWKIPPQFNFATDVVDHWAANDKLALISEDSDGRQRRFRFSEISGLSMQLANALTALGVREGDRIATVLPRIPEWQLTIVAAFRIGAIAVPCPELLRPSDILHRLLDSRARAVVVDASNLDKIESIRSQCPDLRTIVCVGLDQVHGEAEDFWPILEAQPSACAAVQRSADTPAIMYYSSGTTGRPKGILHSQRGLYAWRVQGEHWLDLAPDDVISCSSGTGWAFAGTAVLFGPWSRGACSVMYNGPFDPQHRLELLARHAVTVLAAVPTELRMMLGQDMKRYDLSRLRHVVTGGEKVSRELLERWELATGILPYEGYGQTESLMVCVNMKALPVRTGAMGKPLPGYQLAVLDENGQEAKNGIPGVVAVDARCPGLMLGYWDKPEMTSASYRGSWYITGDVAYRDADGYLWFVERADDIINSAGYRIGPADVESAILKHPAVAECAVFASRDDLRGDVVKAAIVLRDGYRPSEELVDSIQCFVKEETAPYMYPRKIEFLESLPRTEGGKIRRGELRRREQTPEGLERSGKAPWSASSNAQGAQ